MKSFLLPILAIFTMIACTPTKTELQVDETAKEIFTPTELEGIIKTIFYVDSIILKSTNASDINLA